MQFVGTPKSPEDQNLKLLSQYFISFVQENFLPISQQTSSQLQLWIKFKQLVDPPDGKVDLNRIRSELFKSKSPITSNRNLNEEQKELKDSKNSVNGEAKTPTATFRFQQQRVSGKDLNTSEDRFSLPENKENEVGRKPSFQKQTSVNVGKVEYQRVEEEEDEKEGPFERVKFLEITQNLYQQFQQNECHIEILLKMNQQQNKDRLHAAHRLPQEEHRELSVVPSLIYIFINMNLTDLLLLPNRTTQHNLQIYELISKLTFFNNFLKQYLSDSNSQTLTELCGKLKLEKHRKGTVLFLEGDPSNDKMFIIHKGKIGLFKKRESTSLLSFENEVPLDIFSFLYQKHGALKYVLDEGNSFGEKALIENAPRALTAMVYSQEVQLITLHKQDFKVVLAAIHDQKALKQEILYNVFPCLYDFLTHIGNQNLLFSLETVNLGKGVVVFRESEVVSHFYVVVHGEVGLFKNKEMVCSLVSQGLVGDEYLVNKGRTLYRSQVLSLQATLIEIPIQVFHLKVTYSICYPQFPQECILKTKKDCISKLQQRSRLLNQKNILKQQICNQQQLTKTNHEQLRQVNQNKFYSTFRNFLTFDPNHSISQNKNTSQPTNYLVNYISERQIQIQKTLQKADNLLNSAVFDYGKGEKEAIQRKNYYLSIQRRSQPKINYLKDVSNSSILTLKQNFLKSMKRKNRSLPQLHDQTKTLFTI